MKPEISGFFILKTFEGLAGGCLIIGELKKILLLEFLCKVNVN